MKKKIGIIYQKSNRIGYGHYIRSLRLKKILNKRYKVICIELRKNSEILSIIKKKYDLYIFDLKTYSKKIYQFKNAVVFEDINHNLKKIKSINPLDNGLQNSGPEYFIYPESFKNKKKNFYNKNKFNILIVQGRNDSNNQLKKIINLLIINQKKIKFNFSIKIKVKKKFKIKKNNFINFLPNVKNEYNIYKNIDFAISGVGNTAYELGYFGIPTIHFSAEKREIKRAIFFHKKKLAPYISVNKIKSIINELNKFYINDKYKKKIIHRRIKFFKKKNKIHNLINEII
jgi:spore coat polysaccharide biosynthesis predicted glycosyltransferase SpsG